MPNMPKRSGKGGNRIWSSDGGGAPGKKYYYEHDDRAGDSIRRVSFKAGSNRGGKHNSKKWDLAIRAQLEDDDVDMNNPGSSSRNVGRYGPYSGGRGQGGGGRSGRGSGGRSGRRSGRLSPPAQNNRRRFSDNTVSWFRVFIPYGSKYSKEYILKTLMAHISPLTFVPMCYETRGLDASFFVEEAQVAEKIANADKRITTILGYKLLIRVKPVLPHVELNAELKEKIKNAMVKRYNATFNTLDLSKFHTDPDLVNDYTVALFRPNMLLAVIDIVSANIPQLTGLNLSHNKLYVLEHLSILKQKCPNLKNLHLGKNRIRDIHHLDSLQGLQLTELVLDGNPMCDKIPDQNVYISEVRKRFPRVLKLDGIELPPPIVFDVNEEEFKMPPSKANFLIAPEGMAIVRPFLEQYYQIYDSNDRQPLVNAYHENAMFSLTCAYPPGQSAPSNAKLSTYISESRNVLRISDSVRRHKLLYKGKLSVVSCLSKLPKTQHYPSSFAVDLSIFTSRLIVMSVSGLFIEPENGKNPPLRAFHRVFVIVPVGEGFCIINEELFVTNATNEQIKAMSETPPVMSPPTPAHTPVPVATSPSMLDDGTKQQMIQTFAMQSGMNLAWSRKCLDETNWDYQQATLVFTELLGQGLVPAEAFIKVEPQL